MDPRLVPKFNVDYGLKDFISSILHLRGNIDSLIVNNLFGNSYIYYTNSGRTSLYIILKSLELPLGSKVGVPLYSCTSVFDSIYKAGYVPVFLDIDMITFNLSIEDLSSKSSLIDCVIVIHTFGRPVDLYAVKKIMNSKPIIEDCAHSVMSKYDNILTGTLTDAGFFTFRTGKYISAGEGSIIVTNDVELGKRIESNVSELAVPSTLCELRHSFKTLVISLFYNRPFYGLLTLPIGKYIDRKYDVMNKKTFVMSRIKNVDLYVLNKKLGQFNGKVKRQKENGVYLRSKLVLLDLQLPVDNENTDSNNYMFPILFSSELERDLVHERLLMNKYDSVKLFSQTPDLARRSYGYTGDCLETEKFSKRILVVPIHYKLKRKNLDKIAEVINDALL